MKSANQIFHFYLQKKTWIFPFFYSSNQFNFSFVSLEFLRDFINFYQFSEIWTKEDLCNMIIIDETFTPELKRRSNLLKAFTAWERALERCLNFYT